jgi:uncharacterized protein (TIGR01777 family)
MIFTLSHPFHSIFNDWLNAVNNIFNCPFCIKVNKKILIAGGSGLIGTALSEEAIRQGWDVTILSRTPGPGRIVWDPIHRKINIKENLSFDAIINLAGSPIHEGRWTNKRKKEHYLSRIMSCKTLEDYLFDGRLTTDFYLGVSGVGLYGDRGDEVVTEETSIPDTKDWMINLVKDWEISHKRIEALDIRTVILRPGIALSMEGGAVKQIINKPGFAVLPYFGNGHQVWPWIHIEDVIGMIIFSINQPAMTGTYLAVAPHPVSNKTFTQTMNHFLKTRRIVAGVPRPVLMLMLGEMHHMLLDSCNASSEKIMKEGFEFKYKKLEEAVSELMKK